MILSTTNDFKSYGNYSLGAPTGEPLPRVNGPVNKPHIEYQADPIPNRENLKLPNLVKCDESKTTCFVEDESIVRKDLRGGVDAENVEVRMTHIYDFLGKPQLLNSGTWGISDPANGQLGFAWRPGSQLSANAIWANKIAGFSLIRGTAVFRVTINANPFQSGMLLAHFLPNEPNRSALDSSFLLMHNVNLTQTYQQPHVEMTCRDAVMELKIPYIAPTSWYDIKAGAIDWGTFYLRVFAPLRNGVNATSVGVDYQVYLHFEDVELAGPVVPQSDDSRVRLKKKTVL